MSQYSKAIAALVVTVLIAAFTAYQGVVGDGMDAQDWVTVILAALAPIAVYFAPRNEYRESAPEVGADEGDARVEP